MILDIIMIVMLSSAAIYGYKKGCVKILTSIASFVLAFVIAYMLCSTAGDYLYNTMGLGKIVRGGIENSLTGYISEDGKVLEGTTTVIEKVQQIVGTSKPNDTASLTNRITGYVFVGLGFALVFILTRIILWIAGMMLDGVFDLPILKQFNELGGAIASVALTILKAWIVLAIVSFVAPMGFMSGIMKLINSSAITSALYEHNILNTMIISKII